jgi:hypothetical protein
LEAGITYTRKFPETSPIEERPPTIDNDLVSAIIAALLAINRSLHRPCAAVLVFTAARLFNAGELQLRYTTWASQSGSAQIEATQLFSMVGSLLLAPQDCRTSTGLRSQYHSGMFIRMKQLRLLSSTNA